MARRTDRPHMTLTEHLALRAQERAQAQERERARVQRLQTLRELDSISCQCPQCQRLRKSFVGENDLAKTSEKGDGEGRA